ncbi:MAG: Spy/CpxP family protein refolding chaperone [Bacteroidales bacterium]|nr:Spy/CpxP family protein refolding chaperone [Bacteroidales bacterium]
MKRNFLIIAGICCMFLFGGQVNAQKEEYKKAMRYRFEPYEKQVEVVLTNLTDNQREALHKFSKENKEYMKKYRKDREQLEKTIESLLAMKEDVSEALFPLIDMKSRLEAEKEKNFYKIKLKIDSILTAEQRAEMDKYEAEMKKKRDDYLKSVEEKRKKAMEEYKAEKEKNKKK